MQKTKSYSGTIALGSATSRRLSYGRTNTAVSYKNKVDILNTTIANFLKNECGVDATYANKGTTTNSGGNSFLWIYGIPFLYTPLYGNDPLRLFGPLSETEICKSSTSNDVFSGVTSGDYNFTLFFTGNPNTAFSLRMTSYNTNTINSLMILRFMKATNSISGTDSAIWYGCDVSGTTGSASTNGGLVWSTGQYIRNLYGGEISNTVLDITGLTTMEARAAMLSYPWTSEDMIKNKNKLLLMPFVAGRWKVPGVYFHPENFSLLPPATATTEIQTEMEVDGRRFIITMGSSYSGNRINMPLIEVEGDGDE